MAGLANHYLSVIRFAKAQAGSMTVVNMDAHTNLDLLPTVDILGVEGFSYSIDGKIKHIVVSFSVMTYDDVDLFRHIALLDQLSEALDVEKQIPVFEAVAGAAIPISWMVVAHQAVEPMLKTAIRSSQLVTVHLISGDRA